MPTIAEVRAKFPQYNDMSDEQLASALHRKFYSDMPQIDFMAKIGLAPTTAPSPERMTIDQAVANANRQFAPYEKSLATRDKGVKYVGSDFENLPWYGKLGQAADDIVRLGANGITLGMADRFAGYMSGDGTEAERAKSAQAAERAGSAGMVAEAGGMMLPAAGLAKMGLSAARAVPQSLTGVKGVLARSAANAVDGAQLGGLAALGGGKDLQEGITGGAIGGAAGSVAGDALSAGLSKVASAFSKGPAIPTTEELRQLGSNAYAKGDAAGVIIAQPAIKRLQMEIQSDLADFGYAPELQPKVASLLNMLARESEQNLSMKGLENIRKVASANLGTSIDPAERAIAGRLINVIEDFRANLTPQDVLTGNSAQASKAFAEGRDYWKRYRKSEMIDTALTKAENRAGSTGSGGNVDNASRQNIRSILDNPKKSRQFSKEERDMMTGLVRGTAGQNVLRQVGKLSPTGNGLMTALGVGGAMVNPIYGIPALAGSVSKVAADKMTNKAIAELSKTVRAGSKSAASAPKNAAQRLAESKRDAITRLLTNLMITGNLRTARPQ